MAARQRTIEWDRPASTPTVEASPPASAAADSLARASDRAAGWAERTAPLVPRWGARLSPIERGTLRSGLVTCASLAAIGVGYVCLRIGLLGADLLRDLVQSLS